MTAAEVVAHAAATLQRVDALHTDMEARRRPTRLLTLIGLMYYDLYVLQQQVRALDVALSSAKADAGRAKMAAMFYGYQAETLEEIAREHGVPLARNSQH